MSRFDLIQAAGWDVPRFVAAVARTQGCTCSRVVMHDRGYLHDAGCTLAHPAHWTDEHGWWTPIDACATLAVELELAVAAGVRLS